MWCDHIIIWWMDYLTRIWQTCVPDLVLVPPHAAVYLSLVQTSHYILVFQFSHAPTLGSFCPGLLSEMHCNECCLPGASPGIAGALAVDISIATAALVIKGCHCLDTLPLCSSRLCCG